MAMPDHPCRIAVFLARDTDRAVILRRGPSAWAQLIAWDRASDTFEPGQWFHGRVYERRCDLSPDGRLFVYIAAKHGGGNRLDPDVGEAWTAVSRPPYFTALALWPNLGSWYGGGVFRSPSHLSLDATCTLEPAEDTLPRGFRIDHVGAATAPWEQRLLRDGWILVERGFDPRTHRRIGSRELWHKAGRNRVTLWREVLDADFRRYGGPHADAFWLETTDDLVPLEGATWADWDGSDLLFARAGQLVRAEWQCDRLAETVLYDFNPLTPQLIEPAAWAGSWPPPAP